MERGTSDPIVRGRLVIKLFYGFTATVGNSDLFVGLYQQSGCIAPSDPFSSTDSTVAQQLDGSVTSLQYLTSTTPSL
jgi:hypothetical protein